MVDVWNYIKNGKENVPVTGKTQYVHDEFIFICPVCGKQISSLHYLNIGYFQIACEDHIVENHNEATNQY